MDLELISNLKKAFRTGLHDYLEKFKYKNTVTEDLWEALSNASKKPVEELMELWTKQTGYPVISVFKILNINGFSKFFFFH